MPGFGTGIAVFGVIWMLLFVGIIGTMIFFVIKGIAQWQYNNGQTVQSVEATVVTKRTSTSGGGNDTSVSTWYHATFETPDGERREFGISGSEYGLLVEGDRGTLTFQGTRYKGFVRTHSPAS